MFPLHTLSDLIATIDETTINHFLREKNHNQYNFWKKKKSLCGNRARFKTEIHSPLWKHQTDHWSSFTGSFINGYLLPCSYFMHSCKYIYYWRVYVKSVKVRGRFWQPTKLYGRKSCNRMYSIEQVYECNLPYPAATLSSTSVSSIILLCISYYTTNTMHWNPVVK